MKKSYRIDLAEKLKEKEFKDKKRYFLDAVKEVGEVSNWGDEKMKITSSDLTNVVG